jgi:N6-L-threonylcarbamoyladenine synthase
MTTISTAASASACAAISASRTAFACHSARSLPRVPILIGYEIDVFMLTLAEPGRHRIESGPIRQQGLSTVPFRRKGLRLTMNVRTVLGIETSCDETAAAIVSLTPDGAGRIVSNVVLSQLEEHAAYGGVVPEIAARAHVEALDHVIASAMQQADLQFDDLDALAVTAGPGLVGGLMVGVMTAKAIAAARGLPLYGVNHLEGHALTAALTDGAAFPYLLLLVSGGHTQLLQVCGLGDYRRLGSTIDDALGEAFDKTAKMLGLPYPGGPAVERAAAKGDPSRFALPRPLLGKPGCDFSFSGLKTAIRRAAEDAAPLTDTDIADLCASFQATVNDILDDRIANALAELQDHPPTALVAAGGVAANQAIRSRLEALCSAAGLSFLAPPPELCTDNAAMIAWTGVLKLNAGLPGDSAITPRARWPLDETAAPMIGHGRKGARA